MSDVLINPHAQLLGQQNAILAGRRRQYDVRKFTGPLSLKSVVRGRATWTTAAGTFEIEPGCALVVNSGEEYDIAIDALQPVETFCVFFRRGFVEDAYRSATTASANLIDATPDDRGIELGERVIYDPALIKWMRVDTIPALASALVRVVCDVDYVHANIASTMTLDDMAGAACLSPFHFHRIFTTLHGETPHRYMRRMRLERARTLLRAGRSATEAALECGFESVGSFTTLFANTFGVTPGRVSRGD